MPLPQKNTAFSFEVSLTDASNRPQLRANPTLAAGDVKVSIDEGAFANITTLPTVSPAGGRIVKVSLSAGEMNGDRIAVQFVDQTATAEWDELLCVIHTSSIVFEQIDTRIPTALVGGKMDSHTATMASGVITAAVIATNAIDSDAIDATAVTEIQAGLSTLTAANVNAEVLDVMNVDTFAEIGQENPAATQTIRKMIAYLYKAWRNRHTQTSSEYKLYADDALTVDQKATTSDDGTTFDRSEVFTGP